MAAIVKRPGAFIETDVDDEIVIVGLDEGRFYSLEGTGRAVWRLIDGTRDRAALLALLQRDFDAPHDILAADLDAFLSEVASAGFIEPLVRP